MESVFKELNRIKVSDSVDVVLSEVNRNNKVVGYSVTKFVTTDDYTGFSKGVFIPEDMLNDFLKMFHKEDLKFVLEE